MLSVNLKDKSHGTDLSCTESHDGEPLPMPIAKWLHEHPSKHGRQFGELPRGWVGPVLKALNALDSLGAEVLLCKFKLGSLRLRVRPEDLSSISRAARIERVIRKAQEDCSKRCTRCGLYLADPCNDIDGARCGACTGS